MKLYFINNIRFSFFICNLILILFCPSALHSQERDIEKADAYFKLGEYQKALTLYQNTFQKKRIQNPAKYNYYYLLTQIAESKSKLKDTTAWDDFYKITKQAGIAESHSHKADRDKILILIANAYYNTQNYFQAEKYYKIVLDKPGEYPDQWLLDLARFSIKLDQFKQALQILNEIEDTLALAVEIGQYRKLCRQALGNSICANLVLNDTLRLFHKHWGCFGGQVYSYAIIKEISAYKVLVYEVNPINPHSSLILKKSHTLHDTDFQKIVNFENELKNRVSYHSQNNSCTSWAEFWLQTNRQSYQFQISDCALGWGNDIEKILDGLE